jgi:hypothetical protein
VTTGREADERKGRDAYIMDLDEDMAPESLQEADRRWVIIILIIIDTTTIITIS